MFTNKTSVIIKGITILLCLTTLSLVGVFFQKKLRPAHPDFVITSHTMAYTSLGVAHLFDIDTKKDLTLPTSSNVTRFIWSSDNHLAVIQQEQGYDSFLISTAHASTGGFKYSVSVVDPKTLRLGTLIPNLYGAVFWSPDSSGLYFSENYYHNEPLPLGNQSGLSPTDIKYFFINLNGQKKAVDSETFLDLKTKNQNFSPDKKYLVIPGSDKLFTKLINTQTNEELTFKNSPSTYIFNEKWSPDNKWLAYGIGNRNDSEATSHIGLYSFESPNQTYLGSESKITLSSHTISFDWIDNSHLLIYTSEYDPPQSMYKSKILIADNAENTRELLRDLREKFQDSQGFQISSDKQFFTYKNNISGEDQLIVSLIDGSTVKILNGRQPAWAN